MQNIAKSRGVRGAASLCALTAILYLLARSLLQLLVSTLMGMVCPGASLSDPVGFSTVAVNLFLLAIGIGSLLLPLCWLLRFTRLQPADLRLTIPAPWSPGFCLPVFLGVANAANLFGGLLGRLAGVTKPMSELPAGGAELFVCFLVLCLMPAVCEELLFRGALQGIMRPCGSAAAIFAPALLFALLHSDPAQILTAFVCGIFLGWLTERTGSLLPGVLLHLVNNCIAFLNIYLHLYAPATAALCFELAVLLFFPLFALWLIYHSGRQGFRFSAGLRPGVDLLAVFTSPAYVVTVVFLLALDLLAL